MSLGGRRQVLVLKRRSRAPYPGEVAGLDLDRAQLAAFGLPLLISDHVTAATGRKLSEAGWSWADRDGNMDIRGRGLLVRQRETTRAKRRHSATLPFGPSSLALLRWLASHEKDIWRTSELANCAGVSVATVSQVMMRLVALELAERPSRGNWRVQRGQLLTRFLHEYPGPGGESRHFYVAGSITNATKTFFEKRGDIELVVSGDVGADLFAPWRVPTHCIIYARSWFDTPALPGLVHADSRGSANFSVVVPDDQSFFSKDPLLVDAARSTGLALAHPTQIMWDLMQLGGEDRLEALNPIRARMGLDA